MSITEDEIGKGIRYFSTKLSDQPLGLVTHQPAVSALASNCISNAMTVKMKDGGEVRYGWYFIHRYSLQYGDYLIATHHAVWYNPKNMQLIDVTPYHKDEKHRPYSPEGNLLFLVDDKAQPIKLGNVFAPLPSRYYALKNSKELVEYVKELQEKEFKFYKEEYKIDFN